MSNSDSVRGNKAKRGRKRNTGLGTLRKLLKASGNEYLTQPTSGFLSQVMGIDDQGNVGFPIDNFTKPPEERKNLGLLDETLALPTLLELAGIEPPEFSVRASERVERLRNAIRDDMGIEDPTGFAENAGESLGVMLGQLPIPSKKKVELAAGVGKKGLAALKKMLASAPEFFSPTVAPKASNYASGAAFGGALGQLGDGPLEEEYTEEEPQRFGAGGLAAAVSRLNLRRAQNEAALAGKPIPQSTKDIKDMGGQIFRLKENNQILQQQIAEGKDQLTNPEGFASFLPGSGAVPFAPDPRFVSSMSLPDSLNRVRVEGNRPLKSLFKYGQGPESTYFSDKAPAPTEQELINANNGEFGFGPDAIIGPDVRAISLNASGGNNPGIGKLNSGLAALRRRLGKGAPSGMAEGGIVQDPDQMAQMLTELVMKYRQS